MMPNLTEAQRQLLRDCSDECGTYCDAGYRPGQALVRLGLAEWEDGHRDSCWLNITPAGRAALGDQADD